MSVAVASFALVRVSRRARSPLFLDVVGRALVAVAPGRVVLTLAVVLAVLFDASVRVPVAHAAPADLDVLDRVKITLEHFRVVVARAHEVAVMRVDFQKTDSDFRGAREFLQLVGGREGILARATIDERDDDFSALAGVDLRVLVRADDVTVGGVLAVGAWDLVELRPALGAILGEILPRVPVFPVDGALEHPGLRPRTDGVLDDDVGDVEGLLEVEGERDLVVLLAAGKRGRHPEALSSVDDVFNWVAISAVRDASSARVEIQRAVLVSIVLAAGSIGGYCSH